MSQGADTGGKPRRRRFSIVAGMRRMRVSQKLAAFCVSFTIPTAVLLYYYTKSVDETIGFARKEQCGLRYNQPLRRLLQTAQDLPAPSAMTRIDQGLAELAAAEQSRCVSGRAADELDTSADYARIATAWQALRAAPDDQRSQAFEDSVLALFTHVGDTSNLILDPDLDTYYVMDLVLIRFPDALALLDDASSNAAGAADGLRRHAAAIEHNLRVGFDNNRYYPGSRGTLKAALAAPLDAYLQAVRALVGKLESNADGASIQAAREAARQALYPLYDVAERWEDRALDARASDHAFWEYVTIALITILLMLSSAFALLIGRDTVLRLGELERVSARMARGELDQTVKPRGRDEVTALAQSFNKMAGDLKRMYAGIEAQVHERTGAIEQQARQLELIRAVAEAANTASSRADALRIALERVCAHMSWPVGHAWLMTGDGSGELESTRIWHLDEPSERFTQLKHLSESLRFERGTGLPGRVLASGEPLWISDVLAEPNFPRAKIATDLGVRTGFGFPILAGREVVGVLEFFSTEPTAPDPSLLQAMASVGTHLGRVIERERAAAALAERERRALDVERLLRDVTDNAPGFFFQLVIDTNNVRRYNFISQGIERVSGYTVEEVTADPGLLFRITDAETQQAIRVAWANSWRTMTPYRVDYRLRTKSGEMRWLRGAGRPALLDDGSMLWNGFTIDITAEREAEELHRQMERRVFEAEQQMRDVIENLPGVVYQLRVDPTGHFQYDFVSSRNIDVWGVSREKSMEDPLAPHRLVVPEDQQRVRAEWAEAMRTMTPLSTEFRIVRPDGKLRWLRSNATPRPAANGYVILNGHTLDITETKEAESRVALAEQRLREFTENLPGLVWQLEIEWGKPLKYNYLTDHTMQVYGLPREEVLKNPDRVNAMFLPQDMPRVFKLFQESLKTMTPIAADFRVKRADNGEIRWLRTYSVPRKTATGVQTSGFTWEITAEKEAEEKAAAAQRLVREVTDSVPGIVYQMRRAPSGDVKFHFISGAVERFSGVPQQTAQDDFGAVMNAMFPEDRVKVANAIRKSVETGLPAPVGWRVRTPDGSVRWMHSSAAVRREPDGTMIWNGFAADVTQLKETEDALARAKEAAESANRAKSDFLANMSHEIRTPMNAIIGLSQLALQAHLPAREHDYLDKIHRAARSLLGIINDILDFSKIEAGKLALEHTPFRLADVLENVSSLIGMKAAEKELAYSCAIAEGTPAALIGDPLRLGQVLINLAGNAVKFTERGEIGVRVALERTEGRQVALHFSVRDTGIGIPEDKLAHLFESFYQADASTTRRYGGTGLGLSISRRLVEAMHGRVWVESNLAEGSTFHFTARFDMATQEQIEALPVAQRVHRLDGVRVLVVEDNETNQIIAREILEEAGARVVVAANGAVALDAIEPGKFDIVLMDVHMPVMDGHQATRLIRRHYADLPIVAMTASATVQDRERCAEAGMNDHISKPIDVNELLATLRRHLRIVSPLPPAGEAGARAPGEGGERLPGIDVAAGVRRLGGKRGAFDQVLRVFRGSVGEPMLEIGAALENGRRDQAAQLAHRLRGAAANIAATRLAAAAEEIERTLKAGGDAQPLMTTLRERWTEVDQGLTRFFAEIDAEAPTGSLEDAEIAGKLAELDSLLSRDDADAVTLLRNLRAALAQGRTTVRFAELEKRVSNYDFSAARQALQALRSDLGLAP